MFRNSHLQQLRQAFANQFSDGGDGFIYRKHQKGVPVRVSELERDAFVATFSNRIRFAMWSIVPATFGLILLLVWLTPDSDSPAAQIAMWGGIGAILLPSMVMVYWAWGAPSRELEHRLPEGPALTKEEARALALSKITYGQLAVVVLIGGGLVWKMSTKTDIFRGFGLVWLILGAALVVTAGVQALRKRRFSQR
nr:hypothetical protein [uncultured Sphingomonas sp.]